MYHLIFFVIGVSQVKKLHPVNPRHLGVSRFVVLTLPSLSLRVSVRVSFHHFLIFTCPAAAQHYH